MNIGTRILKWCRSPAAVFTGGLLALCFAFGHTFANLLNYAWQNEFNTYVLAVPLVAGIIAALDPPPWPAPGRSAGWAGIGIFAALLLIGLGLGLRSRLGALDLQILGFVALLAGWTAFALGSAILKRLAYPLVLLVAMAPLPAGWLASLENDLQSPSAIAASYGFDFLGESYLQPTPLAFQLPGIRLDVAPECSGIQSTLALAIVSLAAGYLFLPRLWQRILFTLAAIPIGIFRNALRIVTVGELCTHYGPHMIDSYVHRHGGWIFFVASLVPFFLLAFILQRMSLARTARS